MEVQIKEFKAERKVLYDRLGVLGLGGPLFTTVEPPDEHEEEETQELVDPEEEFNRLKAKFRRRPSRLADALTRKAQRDRARADMTPSVKWIPKVDMNAALDEAEVIGSKQA